MRYVFVGGVKFSGRCLETLLDTGVDLAAILCPRKAPNNDYEDLGPVAVKRGRKVRYFDRIAEEAEFLRSLKPDVVFILGLSQLLPKELLDIPRLGCIGSHPAKLPSNRGRHPLVWAVANGLTESALTFLFLDEGVDSGDIWMQRDFPIGLDDDAGAVYERVCALASKMLEEGVPELERGVVRRTPQDHSRANVWRKRGPKDGRIDWRMSSRRIHDLVRALRPPYPGATSGLKSVEYKVWRTEILARPGIGNLEPGKVLEAGPGGFVVKTGDGAVKVLEHEFAPTPQPGEYLE